MDKCPICGTEISEEEVLKLFGYKKILECKACNRIWNSREDFKKSQIKIQINLLIDKGASAFFSGKNQKALEYFDMVIKIDPNNADAWNFEGAIFNLLNESQKAIECFERALKINPNRADSWFNIGDVLTSLGEDRKALECYEKAINLRGVSDNVLDMAWYGKGKIHFKLKQFKEALRSYDNVLEINPNHKNAWQAKGNLLKELNREKEAEQCFRRFDELL